jgi:hypothetical protein
MHSLMKNTQLTLFTAKKTAAFHIVNVEAISCCDDQIFTHASWMLHAVITYGYTQCGGRYTSPFPIIPCALVIWLISTTPCSETDHFLAIQIMRYIKICLMIYRHSYCVARSGMIYRVLIYWRSTWDVSAFHRFKWAPNSVRSRRCKRAMCCKISTYFQTHFSALP